MSDETDVIFIPATIGRFVAREHFIIDRDGVPAILTLGKYLLDWFIDKEEEPMPQRVLRAKEVLGQVKASSVIDHLGGEDQAETSLTEVFYLLETQARELKGYLLIDGTPNIFFVRDISSVLRVVSIRGSLSWPDRRSIYWHMRAFATLTPSRWGSLPQCRCEKRVIFYRCLS